MAVWIAKAIIQKGISFLPAKRRVNYLFQKYVTRGLTLTDALFESKLIHASQHFDAMMQNHTATHTFQTFELGTGWYPVVPLAMYIFGVDEMYSADIESLLTTASVRETMEKFIEYHEKNKLVDFLGNYEPKKIAFLQSIINEPLEHQLEAIHLHLIIGDVMQYKLPENNSIGLIHSNNVFEHIPAHALTGILNYFHTIISTDGIMSHFIDMSDHFSHLDKSISAYHFLQYSERQWKLIDNSIQPQNRLRVCQFRKLFIQTGWKIIDETNSVLSDCKYADLRLNSDFSKLVPADVMVTHAHIVCKAD